jgi:hypothetical protein
MAGEPLCDGRPDRPIQEECYRWWATVGVTRTF